MTPDCPFRPEDLPANDAIRNGIVFEAMRTHRLSKCTDGQRTCRHVYHCTGPEFGKCFTDDKRDGDCVEYGCRIYPRVMREAFGVEVVK